MPTKRIELSPTKYTLSAKATANDSSYPASNMLDDSDNSFCRVSQTVKSHYVLLSGFGAATLPPKDAITSVKVYAKLNYWNSERYTYLYAMQGAYTAFASLYGYTLTTTATRTLALDAYVDKVLQALNESSFGIRINMSPTTTNGLVDIYFVKLVIEYDVAVNKVVYNGTTLIDLTQDTVVESALAEGYTAHAANGSVVYGSIPDGDLLGYGLNTSSRVNVAQADYAVIQDYTGSQTGKAIAELAVLSE